jgi:hypothetical protein
VRWFYREIALEHLYEKEKIKFNLLFQIFRLEKYHFVSNILNILFSPISHYIFVDYCGFFISCLILHVLIFPIDIQLAVDALSGGFSCMPTQFLGSWIFFLLTPLLSFYNASALLPILLLLSSILNKSNQVRLLLWQWDLVVPMLVRDSCISTKTAELIWLVVNTGLVLCFYFSPCFSPLSHIKFSFHILTLFPLSQALVPSFPYSFHPIKRNPDMLFSPCSLSSMNISGYWTTLSPLMTERNQCNLPTI